MFCAIVTLTTTTTVVMVSATVNAMIQPYADPRANFMRMTADASLFFTLLCLMVLHHEEVVQAEEGVDACEVLSIDAVGYILIFINFFCLILAALQEAVRRILSVYQDIDDVGISYLPEAPLGQLSSPVKVFRGQYKASVNAEPVRCAVKIRKLDSALLNIEAAISLQCAHTNVIKIYRAEEDAALYYLASELCTRSLETAAREDVSFDRILEFERLLQVCKAITYGLEAMHQSGFTHGNLTPSNVLLDEYDEPRICGFSCAARLSSKSAMTHVNTISSSLGFQPAEVLAAQKMNVVVEVADPVAVDMFSLGCTLCFTLTNGQYPFRKGSNDMSKRPELTIENNIVTGEHGIGEIEELGYEAKDLIECLVHTSPEARLSTETVQKHPLFWTMNEKLIYLGETIGSALPVRVQRKKHPFIDELELEVDAQLGEYDDAIEGGGEGSWSARLDERYPLGGDWGKSQRPPEDEELFYHIYGAPPSKKQAAEREKQVAAGKVRGSQKKLQIRSVGLLKFMRNVYVHRAQMVENERFEDEDAVCHYLLDPFPWLFMAVRRLDEKHGMSGTVGGSANKSTSLRIGRGGAMTKTVDYTPSGDANDLLRHSVLAGESVENPLGGMSIPAPSEEDEAYFGQPADLDSSPPPTKRGRRKRLLSEPVMGSKANRGSLGGSDSSFSDSQGSPF